MSTPPHPSFQRKTVLLALLAVALLAWWPLLLARPVAADDHLNGELVRGGIAAYWQRYGIWRLAGHPLPFWLRESVPYGDRVAALGLHLSVVALFYLLLRRLIAAEPVQLAAALIFAVAPFGFQALTWNSAFSYALSTFFVLLAFFVTLRPVTAMADGAKIGLAAGFLGFLSLASNEATLLLIAWLALYQLLRKGAGNELRPRWLVAAFIVIFEAAWTGLHLATKRASFHKNLKFDAAATVSGLYYQHRQLSYFTHLPHLTGWLPPAAWFSAFAVLAVLAGWAFFLRTAPPTVRQPPGKSEALAFAVLPIAAVSVYALGGGFSCDARKAYPIWAFFLLAGAWFLAIAPAFLQRLVLWIAVLVSPVLVLSSQATTRIWAQTSGYFELAETFILDRHLEGPYAFEWQPDVYAVWPDFDPFCGFRFDTPWVVGAGVGPSAEIPGPPRTRLKWQPETSNWKIESQ